MQLPIQVYRWLVAIQVISNQGEVDDKGSVTVADSLFENGTRMGQLIQYLHNANKTKSPTILSTVRNESTKNVKATNWHLIWLSLQSFELLLDPRIKQLILQGEHTLISEIIKQLARKDPSYQQLSANILQIKEKIPPAARSAPFDIKKLNLAKDPNTTQSSLQFLILLLSSSLSMSVEEILGLFTNQNKYLAHIIVKGINEKFDAVVLFYSLVQKHRQKLQSFLSSDGENCLYALKAGFISKDARVVELTLQLFSSLSGIYNWFVSEDSKCAHTLLLGLRRHPVMAEKYWDTLLVIIQSNLQHFFTQCYSNAFTDSLDMLQITTQLLPFVSPSLTEILLPVSEQWLNLVLVLFQSSSQQSATNTPNHKLIEQHTLENRIVAYDFFAALMLYLPSALSEDYPLTIFTSLWKSLSLIEYTTLINQLICILIQLAAKESPFAKRIYCIIVDILAQIYTDSDKKQHLVLNLIPLISEFPTIPIEQVVRIYASRVLSSNDFLLLCEVVELCSDQNTLTEVGTILKDNFLSHPLVHYANPTLLCELAKKMNTFPLKLMQDVLSFYVQFITKHTNLPQAKQTETKQRQLLQYFVVKMAEVASYNDTVKERLLVANATIRTNNHRVGSKALEKLLCYKFNVTRQQIMDYQKQKDYGSSSKVKESKVSSMALLKTPEPLKRQFEQMIERRKKEEQSRKQMLEFKIREEEKKKAQVKIQLQKVNIERGLYSQAIIKDYTNAPPSVYDNSILPPSQIQYYDHITNLFVRHRPQLRILFMNYSNTSHSNKHFQKFEDNLLHKQSINQVQLTKLLKNLKTYTPILSEVQSLIKEVNTHLMNTRQVHELTYEGFQQFLVQYIINSSRKQYPKSYFQQYSLIKLFFNSFKEKPKKIISKTVPLSQPPIMKKQPIKNVGHIEESEEIATKYVSTLVPPQEVSQVNELNKKLQSTPFLILPSGFKKITEKSYQLQYSLSGAFKLNSYFVVFNVLSEMLNQSLQMHLIEPITNVVITTKAKNIKLQSRRSLSTAMENIPSKAQIRNQGENKLKMKQNLMNKQEKSKSVVGMTSDEIKNIMSSKIQRQQSPMINKSKEITKSKICIDIEKEIDAEKIEALARRNQKMNEESQKLKAQAREEQMKRRQLTQKYLEEKKIKLQEKKRKEEEEKQRKQLQYEEQLLQKKLTKEKFDQFHKAQLDKLRKQNEGDKAKIKQIKNQQEEQQKKQEQLRKKLRIQIQQRQIKIVTQYKEYEQSINRLFDELHVILEQSRSSLTALFEFLLRSTHLSLTQRRANAQVIYETWRYFANVFEVCPLLIAPKEVVSIFKLQTKSKDVSKDYIIGLSYEDFQRVLFRVIIKAYVPLNLIARNAPIAQFTPAVITNDQTDLKQVTPDTIRAFIKYLRIPATKIEQQKRFRQIIAQKKGVYVKEIERLKEKINQIYSSS